MESKVEKLNELKEKELKLKDELLKEGHEDIKDNNPDPVVDSKDTFTVSPANKSRAHKGHIGPDKEPGTF
ncbi:hypothetical protein [Pedobacter glucosidilyticus]|uniref:hypothetical protein n=1 Tax=Pedobacter glucosidilyticus TaxID=1122941 RepID=UPI00041BDA04|nr:hypothetical protein [Pedobacter glucosidilyticus]